MPGWKSGLSPSEKDDSGSEEPSLTASNGNSVSSDGKDTSGNNTNTSGDGMLGDDVSSSHKDTSHNTSGSGGSSNSASSTVSSNSKPTSSSSVQTSSGTGGSSNSASSAVSSNSKPTNSSSGPASSEDSSDATVSILASPGLIAEENFELDAASATGKNGLRVSNIYGSSHRAVMYGDWIYYTTYEDYCIYRMKADGSERTLIYRDIDVAIGVIDIGVSTPGHITNLAVIDGRLYFSCMQVILSCKPDGSDLRIEADSRSEDLMWFGEMGKIYFEGDYGYARDWIFDLKRNKLMAAPIRILTVYDGKLYGNSNGNFVVYDIATKTTKVLRYYTTYMEVFVNDDYIVGYQGIYDSNSSIQNRCTDLFNRKSGTYVKTLVLGNHYLFTHDYGGNLTVCYQQSESKAAILDVNTGEVTYTEFDSSSANFYFTSPDLPYVYVDDWGSLIRYDRYLTSSKIIFE